MASRKPVPKSAARRRANRIAGEVNRFGSDWAKLLDPKNGGPGEPPGRVELIAQIQARENQ